ncbi:MAG: two-component regulator propeller domain-containing protein [Bacteroidota bacterium]
MHRSISGHLWISTIEDGLFRFDGQETKRYPTDVSGDPNIQTPFVEGQNGDLFFSTSDQLLHYKSSKDSLVHLDLRTADGNSIKKSVPFYVDTAQQQLWLVANSRIAILDFQQSEAVLQFQSPHSSDGRYFTADLAVDGKVRRIYAWAWYDKQGFEIWEKDEQGQWQVQKIESIPSIQSGVPATPLGYVSKILREDDSRIWLLTTSNGLIEYHIQQPQNSQLYQHPLFPSVNMAGGSLGQRQQLYISSLDRGALVFDRSTRQFQTSPISTEETGQKIIQAYQDEEGLIWLASPKGVFVSQFQQAFSNPFEALGIENEVVGIVQHPDKSIWVATKSTGIFQFNQQQQLIRKFPFDSMTECQRLSMDARGGLWYNNRESIYHFINGKWYQLSLQKTKDQNILSLFHHHSGQTFVVTINGIKELKWTKGQAAELVHTTVFDSKESTATEESKVDNIYESSHRFTIIPKTFDSIVVYTWASGVFEPLVTLPFQSMAYHMSESRDGRFIRLGSNEGMIEIELSSPPVLSQQDPRQSELESKSIYSIQEDVQGRLWFSTRNGLYLQGQQAMSPHFGTEDGMVSEKFSKYASLQLADGTIWLGTNKGLVVFHPDDIRLYPHPPKVRLESCRIDGEVAFLSEHIDNLETIKLHHSTQSLQIKVISTDMFQPEKSNIRWFIQGKPEKGGHIGPKGNITLDRSILSKNNNILILQAMNAHGAIGRERRLHIYLPGTPIWTRPEFQIAAISLLLIIFLLLWQRNRQERKLKAQQELFEERNRIANDLHDDIGSTLSNISILATLANHNAPAHTQLQNLLHRIEEEAHRSSESLDDIIWSINAQNDPIDRVFARMRRYASEVFEARQINGLLQFPKEMGQLRLDMQKRRQLLLFYKEAINNLSKYANCQTAQVIVTYQPPELQLIIQDDGVGFDPTQALTKGNGLKSMHARIRALKGRLDIQSAPDEGTRIEAFLPITETGD